MSHPTAMYRSQARTWTLTDEARDLGFEGFGKSSTGEAWHLIRGGRALCRNFPLEGDLAQEAETIPCLNCRDRLWSVVLHGEVR